MTEDKGTKGAVRTCYPLLVLQLSPPRHFSSSTPIPDSSSLFRMAFLIREMMHVLGMAVREPEKRVEVVLLLGKVKSGVYDVLIPYHVRHWCSLGFLHLERNVGITNHLKASEGALGRLILPAPDVVYNHDLVSLPNVFNRLSWRRERVLVYHINKLVFR